MAKNKKSGSGGFWLKVLGVLVLIGIVQAYPVILVIGIFAGTVFLGFKIRNKIKVDEKPEEAVKKSVTNKITPCLVIQDKIKADEKPETAVKQTVTDKITPYPVKGVFAHEKDIFHNLMEINPEFSYTKSELIENCVAGFPVYKWIPKELPAELIPEPDNKYDPNAVRVVYGGITIGHIPRESCLDVLAVINEGRLLNVAVEITGGNFKLLEEDYDPVKDKSKYELETGYAEVAAKVYVKERLK